MAHTTHDNDEYSAARRGAEPDAHGQAAMLLTESLIFGLIERSVISVADAIGIVEAAADVKVDVATEVGESSETMQHSLNLLTAISDSLKLDEPSG
ncbi:MAG TPA: hypothetical protein VGD10_09030 [Allosphingosinicella sp.]|uniref:hypothetical protein n=1 Tax=Allosphingosinicella sp. TaxID=2823234 RepID=UPI002ED94B42